MERFWIKVDRFAGATGCWTWTASRLGSYGYGSFDYEGRTVRAHWVSFCLMYGPPPEGAIIRHTCDNPPCVNPAHLVPGTWRDNMLDRSRRYRHNARSGERHGMAKLTDTDVREIRAWYGRGGWRQQDIADAFGVGQMQISRIVRGEQRRGQRC